MSIKEHVIPMSEDKMHLLCANAKEKIQQLYWQICTAGKGSVREICRLHTIISKWNILQLPLDLLKHILSFIPNSGTTSYNNVACTSRVFWDILYRKVEIDVSDLPFRSKIHAQEIHLYWNGYVKDIHISCDTLVIFDRVSIPEFMVRCLTHAEKWMKNIHTQKVIYDKDLPDYLRMTPITKDQFISQAHKYIMEGTYRNERNKSAKFDDIIKCIKYRYDIGDFPSLLDE